METNAFSNFMRTQFTHEELRTEYVKGFTSSPCKSLPGAEEPCPLMLKDKFNNLCENCGHIKNGNNFYTYEEVYESLKTNKINFYRKLTPFRWKKGLRGGKYELATKGGDLSG